MSYHYFSDDEQRRQQTKRMTKEEAVRVAQITARAVTDARDDEG